MIEITQGFTSITAGADRVAHTQAERAPTGARVTLEFSRDASLPPDQPVRVRYEFGGILREAVGIATPTHQKARRGQTTVYHYRLSHWIAPEALMQAAAGNVRHRTDETKGQLIANEGDTFRGDPIRA